MYFIWNIKSIINQSHTGGAHTHTYTNIHTFTRTNTRTHARVQRERDCFYYIFVQTYDVGLHSRRNPIEFDAGTRPFASLDSPRS